MQLGMIGLGRLGADLTRRLTRDGHEVVVFDVNAYGGLPLWKQRLRRSRRGHRDS